MRMFYKWTRSAILNLRSKRSRRSRAFAIGGSMLGAGAVLTIVAVVVPTSAAYTDSGYTRTEMLTSQVGPAIRVGLSVRSLETGGGVGTDGNVYLWGNTSAGLVGTNTGGLQQPPTKVGGLPDGQIATVKGQSLNFNAVGIDGTVYGWGRSPAANGIGVASPRNAPQQIRIGSAWNGAGEILDNIAEIATTEQAGAAYRADGSVWKWGALAYGGSSGSGAQQVIGLPDPSQPGKLPTAVFGGYRNFWVLLADGEVYHWGSNGSTPASDTISTTTATLSASLSPWFGSSSSSGPHVVQIGGGINMGQALLSDGGLLTWGGSGRIGDRPTPPAVGEPGLIAAGALSDVVSISSGFTGMVALTRSGDLYGFGASDDISYGGLPTTPAKIDSNVTDVVAGQGFYVWNKSDGSFWGQGYNAQGAVGLPATRPTSPREISYDMSILNG